MQAQAQDEASNERIIALLRANAQMLAQTKGRVDELSSARAQADLLHRVDI